MSNDLTVLPAQDRDFIAVSGENAARFLHSYCTSDINNMADGDGRETFFPTEKGRVLAYAFIERVGDTFIVSGTPGTAATLIPHLGKYAFLDGTTLTDRSSDDASFSVAGAGAADACSVAFDGAADVRCYRTHDTTRETIRVCGPANRIEELRTGVLSQGASDASLHAADLLRIEAGVPVVGVDISDANLVQEAARTEVAVSFTKGCYLGQEPIARLDAMGHTNRELRTIRFPVSTGIEVGTEITFEDRVVGTITSAASDEQSTIALAMLRKAACDNGTAVSAAGVTGVVERFDFASTL